MYTKNAFNPIPGAKPKGNLPHTAITTQPTIAANAVAVNTAPPGIPSSWLNISGLTARIYDIVTNVVIPANTSVRMVVLLGSNPKSFFIISIVV